MAVLAIEFSEGLQSAWTRIATFVPKLVGFLAILIIGYFVAKVIAKIIDRILERVGFDRVVERGGVGKALAKSRFDASDLLSRIVFYALMLFVLQLAFGIFGPNPISTMIFGVISFLPRLFAAILIVIVAAAIAAAVKEILQASLGGLSYGNALATAASVAILAIGLFAALNQIQIAPAIVNGLFYAILAVIVGSAIVAIGGSGIQPLRQKWEQALSRMDQEAPKLRQQAEGSKERIAQRKDELMEQARAQTQEQPGATNA